MGKITSFFARLCMHYFLEAHKFLGQQNVHSESKHLTEINYALTAAHIEKLLSHLGECQRPPKRQQSLGKEFLRKHQNTKHQKNNIESHIKKKQKIQSEKKYQGVQN